MMVKFIFNFVGFGLQSHIETNICTMYVYPLSFIGQKIYKALFRNRPAERNELFQPGRMVKILAFLSVYLFSLLISVNRSSPLFLCKGKLVIKWAMRFHDFISKALRFVSMKTKSIPALLEPLAHAKVGFSHSHKSSVAKYLSLY